MHVTHAFIIVYNLVQNPRVVVIARLLRPCAKYILAAYRPIILETGYQPYTANYYYSYYPSLRYGGKLWTTSAAQLRWADYGS